jgi:hypothetical protein
VRRLFWTAVGAAGGIYLYRRGTRALEEARERGMAGTVQAATGTALGLIAQARSVTTLATPRLTDRTPGTAAAAVVRPQRGR